MYNNILEKFNFNISEIRLCDSFAGIGALHDALKRLGIPVRLVSMSEIDVDAIISYGASHDIDINNIDTPPEKEMREYLINKNIGFDFAKGKSSIPKLKKDKLELLYKYCIATNNYGDISKINPRDMVDFDLFNFSFPCTDISVAGKQTGMKDSDGNLTRSGLYEYGINIIKNKKPSYIMIENVKNLIGKSFIDDFYAIIKEIEDEGYKCYYPKNTKEKPTCLNAKDYGIPQNRERIFVICIRRDISINSFEFPIGFDNGTRLRDVLETKVDEKYYISEDKAKTLLSQLKDKNTLMLDMCQSKREGKPREYTDYSPTLSARDYKEPRLINECIQIGELDIKGYDCIKRIYSSDGISPTITTMGGGNTEPKILESIVCEQRSDEGLRFFNGDYCGTLRTIDACGDKRVIEIQSEAPKPELVGGIGEINFGKQYRQGNRIYSSDKTAMCLMAQPVGNTGGYSYLYEVNYRIRKLTPLECWRLMGFLDESFYRAKNKGMSDSQLYKQAGNSIVVNVLYFIFKNLFSEYIIN